MDAYINANIMLHPCILLIYDARNYKGEYLGRTFVCFQFTRSLDNDHPQRYFEAHQREEFELMRGALDAHEILKDAVIWKYKYIDIDLLLDCMEFDI